MPHNNLMIFKIAYRNQIHVFAVTHQILFSELIPFIQARFKDLPKSYHLTYIDSDHDSICLNNENDMEIMYELQTNKVKIYIQPN